MKEIDIPENISNEIMLMNIPLSRIKNVIIISMPLILLFYFTQNILFLLVTLFITVIPFIRLRNWHLDDILYKYTYFLFSRKNYSMHEIDKYASIRKYDDYSFFWNDKICIAYEVKYIGNDLLDESKKEELYNKFVEILNIQEFDISIISVYDKIPELNFYDQDEYSHEIKKLLEKISSNKKFLKTVIVFSSSPEKKTSFSAIENIINNISTFEFRFEKIGPNEFSDIIWRLWSGW